MSLVPGIAEIWCGATWHLTKTIEILVHVSKEKWWKNSQRFITLFKSKRKWYRSWKPEKVLKKCIGVLQVFLYDSFTLSIYFFTSVLLTVFFHELLHCTNMSSTIILTTRNAHSKYFCHWIWHNFGSSFVNFVLWLAKTNKKTFIEAVWQNTGRHVYQLILKLHKTTPDRVI